MLDAGYMMLDIGLSVGEQMCNGRIPLDELSVYGQENETSRKKSAGSLVM